MPPRPWYTNWRPTTFQGRWKVGAPRVKTTVNLPTKANKTLLIKSLPVLNREPNEHFTINIEVRARSRQAVTAL